MDGSAPWIKVMTRIFENPKMVAVGALPDGDSLILCWFRILCLAGEQNRGGSIYLTESVAFTPEILAEKWRCKPSLVQMALTVFRKFGMISIDQEGTIFVLNWCRYQKEEGMGKRGERDLKRLDYQADVQNTKERIARKRKLAANRQRDFKQSRKIATGNTVKSNTGNAPGNALITHQVTPGNAPGNASVTHPVTHQVTHLTNGNSGRYDEVTPGNAPRHRIETKTEIPSAVSLLGSQSQPASSDLIEDFQEAKRLICELILNGKDPSRHWSYQADQNLARHLPIPRLEIERIAWFRGLPNDGSPELEKRRSVTETGLTAIWGDEVTRADAFWDKVHEDEPTLEEIEQEMEESDWTAEKAAATRELFPDTAEYLFKRPYEHVSRDMRAQIERQVKKRRTLDPPAQNFATVAGVADRA